jgi:hypothetical protein
VGEVLNASGFHGLAILNGRLVGSDSRALIEVDSDGEWAVLRPGLGKLDQIALMPDGDLVIASRENGDLIRLTAEGGSEVLVGTLNTYGVTIGPDGLIYAAYGNVVVKIDPDTKQMDVHLDSADRFTPRVMGFRPDNKRLYITTINDGGRVFVVDLDEDLNVVGEARIFAEGVGGGHHDGLAIDVCGNLYIPDYESAALWRVTHAGVVDRVWSPSQYIQYGHGAEWGSGQDGWSETSLFLPQPYNDNTVTEIDIGLPPSTWGGKVFNAPYADD